MNARITRGILVVILMVPLGGCPAEPTAPRPLQGLWLFTFENGVTAAVVLYDGGLSETPAQLPPEADELFFGMLSWIQDEETFTLFQDLGSVVIVHTGTVYAGTYMEGVQVVGFSVTRWTASRLH